MTTKEDIKNHGIGLGNVKVILAKYSGNLENEAGDEWFKTKILLPKK